LFIVDSLGNATSRSEMENAIKDDPKADMGRQQKVSKGMFRTVTLSLAEIKCTMLIVGHTYKEMGAMFPADLVSGGQGLKYCSNDIVFLYKSKDVDSQKVQTGVKIRGKVFKSRVTREGTTEMSTILNFATGLDKFGGMLDLAIECGILQMSGSYVVFPDGSKKYASKIKESDWTPEILEVIDEFCKATYRLSAKEQQEK